MKRTFLTILMATVLCTFFVPVVAHADVEEETSSLEEGPPVRRLLLLRSGRFELQPTVSFTVNDPFVRNLAVGASLAYYFNNSLGIGGDFGFAPIHFDTDETVAVNRDFFSPSVRGNLSLAQMSMNFDAGMIWAPIFGKFSLFGLILNYDVHGFAGAGALLLEARCAVEGECTVNDNLGGPKFAGVLGLGTRIYFSSFMALNLELKDYLASFSEYSRGDKDSSEFQNYFIGSIGLSIFLPFDVYISR